MIQQMGRGYMTASEAVAVFRHGLNDELGVATATRYDALKDASTRSARIFEAMHRIAARLAPDADSIAASLVEACTPDFTLEDRKLVVLMLRAYAPHRSATKTALDVLKEMNAPTNERVVADGRTQLLLGRAEGQARASLAEHPEVSAAGDPLARLLDDDLVARLRAAALNAAPAAPVAPDRRADTEGVATNVVPFLMIDTRRFADVIDEVIADIQASGDWNEDVAQRRRVMRSFAWATGNKRLCDYGPSDAQKFAATLRDIPKEFRWGTFDHGNLSRPFDEVMAEVRANVVGTKRSDRTVNRDLTTLSRVGAQLMKTAWKPRYGKDAVVDFTAFASGTPVDNPDDPDRMPWTEEHLLVLFSSPIYTGGGGLARRLKRDANPVVWQDAAYWVPLLLSYGILSREEACGVECEDFVFNVDTPFVAIVENMTKSKDGVRPSGLKRPSRRRMVPLHPELLRLGLRQYIEAIEAAGHVSAFPELYQDGMTNIGGKRFYASAGRYQLDHVDGILPLPRTSDGKRADLHSLRTTGGSALEDSDTKQLVVDDILGHAREGTGPRKYSKAWYMKGGAVILSRRLEVMVAVLPKVTEHLQPMPLKLLPVVHRSRTGSAAGRASRK